ncbi:MAG: DJ-1 family protein [Candidatus Riflebacteria bacterium HGW-Riflebacteria-1]|jgi:DJ-1 family protein|nr:MAG: DJ-1 family protein [Candidatus Riflebacteria bacterium HGW-Riflebacteria-1]
MTRQALVFMAPGFEEMELTITVDVLRRAGIETHTVTLAADKAPVKGSRGISMLPDLSIDEITLDKCDVAILPGGIEGTRNLGANMRVIGFLQKMHAAGKMVAAICAAPAVLVKAGIATGRRATSHPAAAEHMTGTTYCEDRVVIDGNVTTSRAAGTSFEFAFALVEQLMGADAVKQVNKGVLANL